MGRGGLETMIMNYYRRMDRTKVQFDFLVHRDFRADYDDEIEQLGGRIYRIGRLIPWSRAYQQSLDTFFAEHPEYREVHVHQDCLSAVILKAAMKHGVPMRIAHSHNSSQDKNLKYLIKLYYKRQIPQYATALFACGRDAGDWMFGGKPYTIVNNAIDAAQYSYCPTRTMEIRRSLHIAENAFVVGHVGRFSPVKNHAFLLDVFDQLRRENERAVLLLVGDGDLRSSMEEKAKTMGLEDHVLFTGVRNDVCDLMQAMDVFVFPSLYEGLPVSLVEAQAAGLPCLISDCVPDACMLTDLVQKVSLEESARQWAKRILAASATVRRDRLGEIAASGFDIVSNAAWLQQYYIEHWKENE
ncbi:MAG: glycosyltransferase family 1 protein [Candidatus Ventricola sp.]